MRALFCFQPARTALRQLPSLARLASSILLCLSTRSRRWRTEGSTALVEGSWATRLVRRLALFSVNEKHLLCGTSCRLEQRAFHRREVVNLNARQRKFITSSRGPDRFTPRGRILRAYKRRHGLLSLGAGGSPERRPETASCGEGGALAGDGRNISLQTHSPTSVLACKAARSEDGTRRSPPLTVRRALRAAFLEGSCWATIERRRASSDSRLALALSRPTCKRELAPTVGHSSRYLLF
jgi:hypothetical protein